MWAFLSALNTWSLNLIVLFPSFNFLHKKKKQKTSKNLMYFKESFLYQQLIVQFCYAYTSEILIEVNVSVQRDPFH